MLRRLSPPTHAPITVSTTTLLRLPLPCPPTFRLCPARLSLSSAALGLLYSVSPVTGLPCASKRVTTADVVVTIRAASLVGS